MVNTHFNKPALFTEKPSPFLCATACTKQRQPVVSTEKHPKNPLLQPSYLHWLGFLQPKIFAQVTSLIG